MARLPKDVEAEIKAKTYELCEKHNYGNSNRIDSTAFIDMLLNRNDIGGRLKEYLPSSSVRVYIKDTLCGRYTKKLTADKMGRFTPDMAVLEVYGMETHIIGKSGEVTICRDGDGMIYLVDYCTLVRWESALRRILEYMAKTPSIGQSIERVKLCLVIVDQTEAMTSADKEQLNIALSFVNAKALIV